MKTREQELAISLRNTAADSLEVCNRIQDLANRLQVAAGNNSWAMVEHLATRLEALTYRAKLDARTHAITQEN